MLRRMLMVHRASKRLYMPGMRFHGHLMVEHQGKLEKAHWDSKGKRLWDLQPRLRETKQLFVENLSSERIVNNSLMVLPEVLVQIDHLAGHKPDKDFFMMPNTRGIIFQKASIIQIRTLSQNTCPLPRNPLYQLSPLGITSTTVLSHGDPTLKNTLYTGQGPCLIDWESLSWLPRHMDLTHIVAFVCKQVETQYWEEAIWRHWEHVHPYLPGWNSQDWLRGVCWYLGREIVGFPLETQEQNVQYWEELAHQISQT